MSFGAHVQRQQWEHKRERQRERERERERESERERDGEDPHHHKARIVLAIPIPLDPRMGDKRSTTARLDTLGWLESAALMCVLQHLPTIRLPLIQKSISICTQMEKRTAVDSPQARRFPTRTPCGVPYRPRPTSSESRYQFKLHSGRADILSHPLYFSPASAPRAWSTGSSVA